MWTRKRTGHICNKCQMLTHVHFCVVSSSLSTRHVGRCKGTSRPQGSAALSDPPWCWQVDGVADLAESQAGLSRVAHLHVPLSSWAPVTSPCGSGRCTGPLRAGACSIHGPGQGGDGYASPLWEEQTSNTQIQEGRGSWGHGLLHSRPITFID